MISTNAFLVVTTRAARMPSALIVLAPTHVCARMVSPAMDETVLITTSATMAAIHAPRTPPAQTNQDHTNALATSDIAVMEEFAKILTNAVFRF